jgi:hypothetical protein
VGGALIHVLYVCMHIHSYLLSICLAAVVVRVPLTN